jgi:hypothetical protein
VGPGVMLLWQPTVQLALELIRSVDDVNIMQWLVKSLLEFVEPMTSASARHSLKDKLPERTPATPTQTQPKIGK